MKTIHRRNIMVAGYEPDEIAEILYNLVNRYGSRIIELNMDCDGLEFTTTEYIK